MNILNFILLQVNSIGDYQFGLNEIIAPIAVIVSILSFIISRKADIRSKKAVTITNLLGSKETVAFAAPKLLKEGLPNKKNDREIVISAILQACLLRTIRSRKDTFVQCN